MLRTSGSHSGDLAQFICNLTVIGKSGHFILSTKLAQVFHVVNKSVGRQRSYPQSPQNTSADQVIVVDIQAAQLVIQFMGKVLESLWGFSKLNKPFVVRQSLFNCYSRGDSKL